MTQSLLLQSSDSNGGNGVKQIISLRLRKSLSDKTLVRIREDVNNTVN